MKENRICCLFNYASHYREEIYLKMEQGLGCDFIFGDIEEKRIKKVDYSLFNQNVEELHTIVVWGNFNWIKGYVGKSFLKKYRQYILTGEPYCLSSWLVLLFNRLQGKKTYLWSHGWYGDETRIKRILKKVYFGLANGILLYGEHAKKLMMQQGFSEDQLYVIYNSLSYEKQLQIRNRLQKTDVYAKLFKNDYPVLIFTGRLTKGKKLGQLLEAQKLLIDKGLIVNVFVLGDGEERHRLLSITDVLGTSDRVCFYGACYDEEKIAEYYYNATACVSPGNVGLTGIHAMTYGCPVISHNSFGEQMPEFEAIVDGVTGVFFKKDNVVDLADKIEKLIGADKDVFKNNCFDLIDTKFNTRKQMEVLKQVLEVDIHKNGCIY